MKVVKGTTMRKTSTKSKVVMNIIRRVGVVVVVGVGVRMAVRTWLRVTRSRKMGKYGTVRTSPRAGTPAATGMPAMHTLVLLPLNRGNSARVLN